MKKLLALLLALALCLGLLSACGLDNAGSAPSIDDVIAAVAEETFPFQVESIDAVPVDTESTDQSPGGYKTDADLPVYGDYYYDLVNVVLYLDLYGELPPNYITKNEARDLGWKGGSVEDYLEGTAIGGDTFGNREGLLPKASGRSYTECDIDTDGYGSRGARRLVFSSDGLYFYTSNHYESFSQVTVTENYEVIW